MKEYSIIKMESTNFSNGNYTKLLRVMNNEGLSVVKTATYVEENSISHFDLVDITTKYLVMLVTGESAMLKSQLIADDFNAFKSLESKIYASSKESFDADLKKYFKTTLDNEKKESIEQTLAIIKPDGMRHKVEIIKMITDSGLLVKKFKLAKLSSEVLQEQYSNLVNEPHYPLLETYMSSTPVVIMLIEGDNAVEKLRTLVGPTDSRKADYDTIRGRFGTDSRLNAIHASDSLENAKEEINRFFKSKQKIKK